MPAYPPGSGPHKGRPLYDLTTHDLANDLMRHADMTADADTRELLKEAAHRLGWKPSRLRKVGS
jgi:hypothetical protein